MLQKERDKAQEYLDIAAVMMVAVDVEERVGLINKKGCEILGYKAEEVIGKNWFDNFLPPRIKHRVRGVFEKLIRQAADAPEYYENLILTKDGNERLIAWHNTVLRDDESQVIAILCSGEDITERKIAEQKLLENQAKLKSLASELTLAEERERRRIAMELHDRIGQSLVISKMNLDELRQSVPDKKLSAVLDEVCNSLGQTIVDTRTLTFDLSSPIFYELGFEAAVAEWLTEQIQEKHGIATQFEDDGQPKPLDDDISIFLFRDVRELLINVVKHARAKNIKVAIHKVGSRICVSVQDDGVGFDLAEAASTAAKKAEFGLFSIRQRLEELGGHLEIKSEPGRGCKATMTAPLKQE